MHFDNLTLRFEIGMWCASYQAHDLKSRWHRPKTFTVESGPFTHLSWEPVPCTLDWVYMLISSLPYILRPRSLLGLQYRMKQAPVMVRVISTVLAAYILKCSFQTSPIRISLVILGPSFQKLSCRGGRSSSCVDQWFLLRMWRPYFDGYLPWGLRRRQCWFTDLL